MRIGKLVSANYFPLSNNFQRNLNHADILFWESKKVNNSTVSFRSQKVLMMLFTLHVFTVPILSKS